MRVMGAPTPFESTVKLSQARMVGQARPGELAKFGRASWPGQTEAEIVSGLPVGTSIWRIIDPSSLVHHDLMDEERRIAETDQRMTS